MLIPAIDLQNGHVVQLVQGEALAIEARDPEPWITRFASFPRVQVIDLDAAKGQGTNADMVSTICRRQHFHWRDAIPVWSDSLMNWNALEHIRP